MRRLLTCLTFSLLFFTALPAFALDDAVNTGFFNDTAIDGYDTVAYFTVVKPTKGNKKLSFTWRDANWFFASEENLALFKGDPEKYAPQYGGWCAYAMSDEGRTVGIDPDAWVIHEGKLYLNYSRSVQQEWLKDKLTNIQQADMFYPKTTKVNQYLSH